MRFLIVAGLAATVAACAPPPPEKGSASSEADLPTGATLGQDGFWSIGEVPAIAWPEVVPEDPSIGQEDMFDKYARENGITREQAMGQINGPQSLQEELDRISQKIKREEAGNFVQFVMVRDPSVRMEVWFKRDAAETLAKYTRDPLFVPREGGLSQVEREQVQTEWNNRLHQAGLQFSSYGMEREGVVRFDLGVTEDQFRKIAKERGWDLSGPVQFEFASPQPAAFADEALAGGVRVFARENMEPGARHMALYHDTIVLKDGCFRTKKGNQLVMFAYDTQLALDDQGYLAVVSTRGREPYRIGEPGNWGGPNGYDEKNPDVIALRKACGEGEIMNVANPSSARLFALPAPQWVTNYAEAKGLTRQKAWENVTDCMKAEEAEGRTGLNARDVCIKQFN